MLFALHPCCGSELSLTDLLLLLSELLLPSLKRCLRLHDLGASLALKLFPGSHAAVLPFATRALSSLPLLLLFSLSLALEVDATAQLLLFVLQGLVQLLALTLCLHLLLLGLLDVALERLYPVLELLHLKRKGSKVSLAAWILKVPYTGASVMLNV